MKRNEINSITGFSLPFLLSVLLYGTSTYLIDIHLPYVKKRTGSEERSGDDPGYSRMMER
jgi:hypothetical protein